MVIPTFECLLKANLTINVLKYAYDAKVLFFVNVNSRYSLETFNKIPGTANIVESLRDFIRKIEEYVYELQKY